MTNPDLSQIIHAARPPSRWKRLGLLIGVIVLLALILIVWRSMASSQAGKVSYVTEPIQRGDLLTTVTATGNLQPTNEVTVGSELSGTVKEVLVDTNDRVTKGQILARLDTSKLERQTESSRATAAAAEAKVGQARATLVETQAAVQRLQKLHTSSGGRLPSQSDMDAAVASAERAKADLASAEAEVRQAQANIGTNESDLEKSIIRAPFDGIILTRNVEPGQTVAATMTAPELFVAAEKLENMKLEVAVAEADIGRVQDGQKATFTVDAWPTRHFEATVKKVEYGSTVTDNVVTYTTELEVSNDDLSLRPGMTATAEIAVAEAKNALLVPNAALRYNPATTASSGAGSGPKKSFVQSLIPSPPRRMAGTPKTDATNTTGPARIWVLRGGQPAPIEVQTGLSDGRVTVISGEQLTDGLPAITHAKAATP